MPPRSRSSKSPSSSPARTTSRKRIRLETSSSPSTSSWLGYTLGTMGLSVLGAILAALLVPQSIPSLPAPFDRALGQVDKLRTIIFASAQGGDPPAQSQFINLFDSLVLDVVPPPTNTSYTEIFIPPGYTMDQLMAKPFHVYDQEFYSVLGNNPTLTRIAYSPVDPLFHEAVVWYPPTDEVFFAQNAGATDAGTGANKSAIIQKISLAQAARAASPGIQNNTGVVEVQTVNTNPPVINPNGGTNYRGQLVFAAEGQNADKTSQLMLVNPNEPYNTTILLNNFFGRQFNSLNDVAVHPTNRDLYFTDVTYGWLQFFRPSPNLPNQVYRYCSGTGLIQAVADGFSKCNGVTFSPDGKYAYVADTGVSQGTRFPADPTLPASLYRFVVEADGSWSGRSLFAYISPGNPDGVHCDANGNVYAGCGDGIQVFNPSGKLIGKIFVGGTSANFQFANHRMVICAETSLWYAELGVNGASITDL